MAAVTVDRPAAPRAGELLRAWRVAPAAQPARPRLPRRRLDPPPELRRDRPVAAEPHASSCTSPSTSTSRCASRNELLVAAGYAPVYGERDLEAPQMAACAQALDLVLDHQEPFPALVVDRRWNLVRANEGAALLLEGVATTCSPRAVNVLRLSLHPDGLAPRIDDFATFSGHVLARLRRQVALTGDEALAALHDELCALPRRRPHRAVDRAPRRRAARARAHRRRRAVVLHHRGDLRHRRRRHAGRARRSSRSSLPTPRPTRPYGGSPPGGGLLRPAELRRSPGRSASRRPRARSRGCARSPRRGRRGR